MLILAVAVFVALFANAAFFASVASVYGVSAKSAPFIVSLFCFITSIFVLILSAVCHRTVVKPVLIAFLLLASVIGAAVGIAMKLAATLREGRYVPFGPFLAGAGMVVMLAGAPTVLDWIGWS